MRCTTIGSDGHCEYREVYEYDYVWEKPSFPGGDVKLIQFINKHRKYPEAAYKAGIQGRVVCSFIVNTDGSVSDIQIFKGVEPSLNKEAQRIFHLMPHWNPGKLDGIPVPVRVIRAVPFRK
jgi:protein TonB